MFSEELLNTMRAVCSGLQTPVVVVLLILLASSVLLLGSLLAEGIVEHRQLRAKMPLLVDALRGGADSPEGTIAKSALLRRQKAALIELTQHPGLTDTMREALAVRLVSKERARYDRITKVSDMIVRLGPVFGLLGTLIPLGPGVIALGQGDTYTLSTSLLTAFDTTIIGLVSAALAMVVSAVRKSWYNNYMSVLETLAECVLEVEKRDE